MQVGTLLLTHSTPCCRCTSSLQPQGTAAMLANIFPHEQVKQQIPQLTQRGQGDSLLSYIQLPDQSGGCCSLSFCPDERRKFRAAFGVSVSPSWLSLFLLLELEFCSSQVTCGSGLRQEGADNEERSGGRHAENHSNKEKKAPETQSECFSSASAAVSEDSVKARFFVLLLVT